MKDTKYYFAYRGDELLTWGDIKHVAKFLNVKEDSIKWYTTKSAKQRVKRPDSLMVFSEKELGI